MAQSEIDGWGAHEAMLSSCFFSGMVSPRPSCMSRGDRKRLAPPSRATPDSKEIRVRVDGRSNISATTVPASHGGQPAPRAALSSAARSSTAATASGG